VLATGFISVENEYGHHVSQLDNHEIYFFFSLILNFNHLIEYINMLNHAIEVSVPFKTVKELDRSTNDLDISIDFEIIKMIHVFSR